MPESDLTEKLLTKDLPEEMLVILPERMDPSILFKEALMVDFRFFNTGKWDYSY